MRPPSGGRIALLCAGVFWIPRSLTGAVGLGRHSSSPFTIFFLSPRVKTQRFSPPAVTLLRNIQKALQPRCQQLRRCRLEVLT